VRDQTEIFQLPAIRTISTVVYCSRKYILNPTARSQNRVIDDYHRAETVAAASTSNHILDRDISTRAVGTVVTAIEADASVICSSP
jgi:hypothetical protein